MRAWAPILELRTHDSLAEVHFRTSDFKFTVHVFFLIKYYTGGYSSQVISWLPSDGYLLWTMLAFTRLCKHHFQYTSCRRIDI